MSVLLKKLKCMVPETTTINLFESSRLSKIMTEKGLLTFVGLTIALGKDTATGLAALGVYNEIRKRKTTRLTMKKYLKYLQCGRWNFHSSLHSVHVDGTMYINVYHIRTHTAHVSRHDVDTA